MKAINFLGLLLAAALTLPCPAQTTGLTHAGLEISVGTTGGTLDAQEDGAMQMVVSLDSGPGFRVLASPSSAGGVLLTFRSWDTQAERSSGSATLASGDALQDALASLAAHLAEDDEMASQARRLETFLEGLEREAAGFLRDPVADPCQAYRAWADLLRAIRPPEASATPALTPTGSGDRPTSGRPERQGETGC